MAEWASSIRVKKDEKAGNVALGLRAVGDCGCCITVESWESSLGRAEGRSDLMVAGEAGSGMSIA